MGAAAIVVTTPYPETPGDVLTSQSPILLEAPARTVARRNFFFFLSFPFALV